VRPGGAVRALTEDAVAAKRENAELARALREAEDARRARGRDASAAALAGRRAEALARRVAELQEELAPLVSAEVFNGAAELARGLQEEATALGTRNRALERWISRPSTAERRCAEGLEQEQWTAREAVAQRGAAHLALTERWRRVELLEVVLKEKNREIWALERVVGWQMAAADADGTAINWLAEENQRIRGVELAPPGHGPIAGFINPAFLSER
jgi:hypothetical protein